MDSWVNPNRNGRLIVRIGLYVRMSWKWWDIREWKRNRVQCSCRPHHYHIQTRGGAQSFDNLTCDHIRALYENRVTEDDARVMALVDRRRPPRGLSATLVYRAIFYDKARRDLHLARLAAEALTS